MKLRVFSGIIFLVFLPLANALVINEIMYNPNGTDSGREWIELYNNGQSNADLEGYYFLESGGTHALTLVQGDYILEPDDYAIIAEDTSMFMADYPSYSGTLFDSSWAALSNTGEFVAILNDNRSEVDSVNYTNIAEEGYSIELKDPFSDNSLMQNWAVSSVEGGSPGAINGSVNSVPDLSVVGVLIILVGSIITFMLLRKR